MMRPDQAALPPENIYGHTAKLRYLLEELAQLRAARKSPLRILDLGCGNGWAVTRFLGQSGDQVVGVDLHAPSVAYAQRHFAGERLSFRCADIEMLQKEEALWDVIVLADVLEHLRNPEKVLENCRALLDRGGRVLVALPNGFGPFEMESLLSRLPWLGPGLLRLVDIGVALLNKFVFRGAWTQVVQAAPADIPYNDHSPHVQFRTHGQWIDLFRACGLDVGREHNLTFLSGPFSNYLLGASSSVCAMNVHVARYLPRFFVSSWVFTLIPKWDENRLAER